MDASDATDRRPEDLMTERNAASGAELLCDLLNAAQSLGLQTAPLPDDPTHLVPEVDPAGLPKRMFTLVRAIERLNDANPAEIDQILDASVTQLRLKIALYAVLGWLAANGLPTGEVSAMIRQAMDGPSIPTGSLAKLQAAREALRGHLGAAAPKPMPGG